LNGLNSRLHTDEEFKEFRAQKVKKKKKKTEKWADSRYLRFNKNDLR
jgi:hypothetical protein